MWIDIACIVFVCVTINHLGLISAIEEKLEKELVIFSCPKCFTFWSVLVFQLVTNCHGLPQILAISFLASYSALWLELLEAYIDTKYMEFYEKITKHTTDDKAATGAYNGNAKGTMP